MNNEKRMDRIVEHFEKEADEFDRVIQTLIPHYNQMADALVSAIPFPSDKNFSVIDLGCGTGTISKKIQDTFSYAQFTCLDISKNMLEIARKKLGEVKLINADFSHFSFEEKYDLIVSSLALHHLENDTDKTIFYQKIYEALSRNGVFINIDVVLGTDDFLQEMYMGKWQTYLEKSVSKEEIQEKWLKNYYAEDRPAKLMTHIDMLKECGFVGIDVIYKYYNFAVYIGKK